MQMQQIATFLGGSHRNPGATNTGGALVHPPPGAGACMEPSRVHGGQKAARRRFSLASRKVPVADNQILVSRKHLPTGPNASASPTLSVVR